MPPGDEQQRKAGTPDWNAPITLQEAAAISGLAYATLRGAAAMGVLRTERVGSLVRVTSRRWLDEYLRSRGTRDRGRPPKPLPPNYQAPPRKGRPPKSKSQPAPSGEEG